MEMVGRCGGASISPMDDSKYILHSVAIDCSAPEELVIKRGGTLIEHRMGFVLKLVCVIEV
jgi:hypothetical protein